MTSSAARTDTIDAIGTNLPFLRRYARALAGNQASGDRYAAATLEAILEDQSILDESLSPKVALFRVFQAIWESAGEPVEDEETGLKGKVQGRLRDLTPGTRDVLLLYSIEEFTISEIAAIMQIDRDEAETRLGVARREMEARVAGRILIIEDEPIISMDLEGIVADMGHSVTGVARTATSAVEMGKAERPDLVLTDIHLADDSSGIDAANELMAHFEDLPVIFVTAYPERLLTGERPEPAFLIAKPYTEDQVRSAVGQAMFFASTETLMT